MSPKLTRLLLAASLAVGFGLSPMAAIAADERTIGVADGQFNLGKHEFDINLGDIVKWELDPTAEEKHSIAPANGHPGGNTWPTDAKPSGDLEPDKPFRYTFTKPGRFFYFCERHPATMKDYWVDVVDPNPPPPPPPSSSSTSSSTTTTTQPATPAPTTPTTAAPASSAGNKPPVSAAPAPTTTTAKDKKGKDDKKDEETTTTTLPPPPPPVDLPDSAIIPVLPGLTGTTSQNGIEAPGDTPEGDAIALLKSKKGGGDKAMKLLIVSGLGLGVLGIGTAGYKYANRSSKYFPA